MWLIRLMHCVCISCRLLGLDPEAQAVLFDFYSAMLDALMERARREGTLGEAPGLVLVQTRLAIWAAE